MDILFTVCGRAGSSGVKNKNIKSFLGSPLVYYTLSAILLYKEHYAKEDRFDVCLSTDSPELISLAEKTCLNPYVIHRSEELSRNIIGKIDVIRDCLLRTEKALQKQYGMVVDLDITSPLRTIENIHEAIEKKRSHPDTDLIFSVTDARKNPYFDMVKEDGEYYTKVFPSNYTARQQLPKMYDMNGSIYVYAPSYLKDKDVKMLFDGNCSIIKMMDTGVLDINSEFDFELMELIAANLIPKNKGFKEIQDAICRLLW